MPSVKLSVTVRSALTKKYDAAALKGIDSAVKSWIAADRARGIRTVHVALDDAAAMKALKVKAIVGKATAGKVKEALDALCVRLTPDYVVLFGGQDIVPSFVVANPSHAVSGDDDEEVPTDNPYACSAAFRSGKLASYLVPDRVVGRIPDLLDDGDPAWLVDYLATAAAATPQAASVFSKTYAICCDEWKGAGKACLEYLSRAASVQLVSPPELDTTPAAKGNLSYKLHMIKCHGDKLDPYFYGQKGDSYPESLFSGTLRKKLKPGTVAAAMCCYGAQVYFPGNPLGRAPGEWPLASTYLRLGALGFVGSTKIAWVGLSEMMCADWIVAGYLKGVLQGASIGRALLDSKQEYVRWIGRQGTSPDRADQKTLIEFVLLGDPSVQPVSSPAPAGVAPAGRAGVAAALAKPSPLVDQERRQRRMVRRVAAEQIREALPVRTHAGPAAVRRAKKVFEAAKAAMAQFKGAPKAFGVKSTTAVVDHVETKLTGPAVATRAAIAGMHAGGNRKSIEYYWSGRRLVKGHKQVRMVKVETDLQGTVLRTSVVHSS